METKELLKSLKKDLVKVEKKGFEFSGRYFLVVDLQEKISVQGRFDTELLLNAIKRLFETLEKVDEDAGRGLLTMLFLQSLGEIEQKKDAD